MSKIYLFLKTSLVLFVAISLSACYVPIIKKELTIPILEKQPDDALAKAFENLENAESLEIDGDFEFELNMSDDKMSFLSEDLREKIVAFVNDNSPKVLGFDSELGFEPEPSPILAGFPEKILVKYHIDGKAIMEDSEVAKAHYNIIVSYSLEGMSFEASLEMMLDGEKTYFKINTIPDMINIFIAQTGLDIKGKWFELDMDKLEEYQKDMGMTEDEMVLDQASLEEVNKKIMDLVKDTKVLIFKERLRDEMISDLKSYHYKFGVDKQKLEDLIFKSIDVYNEEMASNFPLDYEEDDAGAFVDHALAALKNSSIDIYIDKKDLNFSKLDLVFDFDLADSEMVQYLDSNILLSIRGDIEYKSMNKELSIETPTETEPIMDIFKEQMEDSRSKARDAKRISDVKQISTLLELYAANYESYPEDISQIPEYSRYENPEYGKDSDCPPRENYPYVYLGEEGYEILFCLENNAGTLKAGENTIGTYGVFDTYIENLDTDGDGLSDDDEYNYGTDKLKADTDGDGYTDKDEIDNGYNPNGPGKLDTTIEYRIDWEGTGISG